MTTANEAPGAPPLLRVDGIRVGYPAAGGGLHVVVDGLSLTLEAGEIGCLLGHSGCGKTTVLRAIAGFEPLLDGRIALRGRDVAGPGVAVPPAARGVGVMFQDYALFPHLSVAATIGFGPRRLPAAQREARVRGMLALVDLPESAAAYPHELSGGQQQRVALARALAPAPALLLLDEPFSNLDSDTRQRLAGELRALLRSTGTTVLLVTHDQGEAFAMADRIGVMDRGRIVQWGTAEALYARPIDRFVAGFIGRGEWVPGAAVGADADADLLVRPESLRVDPHGPIAAEIVDASFRGPGRVATVRLPGGATVALDLPADAPCQAGATLRLRLVGAPLAFPRAAGRQPD